MTPLPPSLFDLPEFNVRLFFPRPDESQHRLGAKDTMIKVPGAKLHTRTWVHPTPTAQILIFHGNGEVIADYDDIAPEFVEFGLEVVVVDYRGYGKSTGAPTFRTMLSDAVITSNVVPRHNLRRIVFGRSLGAACAAELAGRGLCDALVLESAGSSLESLVVRRGFQPTALSDDDLKIFEPRAKLARSSVPALVLHGEEDHLIPLSEARGTLAALGGVRKELVVVPGRGHNDISFSDAYWDALKKWVASLG